MINTFRELVNACLKRKDERIGQIIFNALEKRYIEKHKITNGFRFRQHFDIILFYVSDKDLGEAIEEYVKNE